MLAPRPGIFVVFVLTLVGCAGSGTLNGAQPWRDVAPSTFDSIRPGGVSKQWLVQTLGRPDYRSTPDETGIETWRWVYTEVRLDDGSHVLRFGNRRPGQVAGTAYVQIKSGVVTSKWRG